MYVMKLFEKKTGVTKTLASKPLGGYQWAVATNAAVKFRDTAEAKKFMKENMEPYAPAHYDLYLSKIRKSGRGSYGKKRLTGKRLSKSQRAKLRYSLAPGSYHGRTNPDVFKTHQKRIALDTLKMSPAMAGIMGGMSLKEAYLYLLQKEGWSDKKIQDYMREHGHSHTEIQELMKAIHIPRSNPRKRRNPDDTETYDPYAESSNNDDFDLRYEMEEGYVITDRTRGGYDVSLSGKYLGNFGDFDDALAAVVKHSKKSGYNPNVFFVNDHGNVDLLSISVKGNKVSYKSIQSWV